MRTVLITGATPIPDSLRAIVERGSTALVERRVGERGGGPAIDADADRVVFWSGADEPALRSLAEEYGKVEEAERRERVVFISAASGGGTAAPRLPADELFIWPQDEDRLKMAFLTGG